MTEEGRKFRIVIVDDNEAELRALLGILWQDPQLKVVHGGSIAEGTLLSLETNPDLVMSGFTDLEDSIELIRRVKEDLDPPHPTFLIVYERDQLPDFGRGHHEGADDYIERSLCRKVLLPKVRTLLKMRCLQVALKEEKSRLETANELLERNFKEMTAILLKILEVRMPGTSDRAETAKAAAEFLAQRLELNKEARKSLIFAALMHEMGKVGLPDTLIDKNLRNVPTGLMPIFQQYATVGSMIISTITGYRDSAEAVYHQLENYDGTGAPEGLMGEQIPLGARVLRAILFAEELCADGGPVEAVVEGVRRNMHRVLDPRVANPLIEFLLDRRKKEGGKMKLPLEGLKPGMVVAEDVYAASGVKLLPKGVQLQEKILSLLMERNRTDPIVGGVYIARDN
ncbi:MAG TPA: HD domain-containing phosphohydrolase [Syntrophorhabdaceae bacterium]|jgi:response regulator RpfG family c-di-GMP phosphodiesterase